MGEDSAQDGTDQVADGIGQLRAKVEPLDPGKQRRQDRQYRRKRVQDARSMTARRVFWQNQPGWGGGTLPMKKKFSVEQIVVVLKQAEVGVPGCVCWCDCR